ncbi:hypothetical protein ACWDSJ_35525 [Nocardia sp. NPDC003482]|jgi:hypothetical protein|uniref:hypothetical protein n=1 Tax=Nocardia TaxID=1817 RepID=UPI00117C508E|nr:MULTISPECIES: hypothetical protein [Nocardia]MDN2495621.1 hypothetical protein [Nocardia nova]
MNNTSDTLAVNQLLGRLVYFHVLFIEPSWQPRHTMQAQRSLCCRHIDLGATHVSRLYTNTTPWTALIQIAADLGAWTTWCEDSQRCCPACRIRSCAVVIVDCWATTEQRAFGGDLPVPDDTRRRWSTAIAELMVRAFAHQHGLQCAVRSNVDTTSTPPPDRFPLTFELARLWRDPTCPDPVVSWLNHCTRLDDIAERLCQGRKT